MEYVGKIESAVNARISKSGGGFIVGFRTSINMFIGSILAIKHNDQEYTFEVCDIEVEGIELKILAKENGYWASSIRNSKEIDIRTLMGIEISMVTDKEELARIEKESNWC